MSFTADDAIAAYLRLRGDLEAAEKAHKEATAGIRTKMGKLESWLQNSLQTQGLTNFKGESGIAFMQQVANVSVKDWDATLEHVKAQGLWEMLEHRVSKTAVLEYLDEFSEPPPGIEVSRTDLVRVRRN